MTARVLMINPWVYDFAAFDLWARPMGLLYLGAALKKAGYGLELIDCMDRLAGEPSALNKKTKAPLGTGHWRREKVPNPIIFENIPRRFARYGLEEKYFMSLLAKANEPDIVLVTSMMTYWYPGVHRVIELVREVWPSSKIMLGGTYATLCADHAKKYSGADMVVTGPAESKIIELIASLTDSTPAQSITDTDTTWENLWPEIELYQALDFAPLMTSRGCPMSCPYCASACLFPNFIQRDPADVIEEIADRVVRLGLTDFAFFDDALLINKERHLMPILETVLARGLKTRFHAPNGLHVAQIDKEMASLMYRSGFKTVRLGLESLDWDQHKDWGGKLRQTDFQTAFENLIAAGFTSDQIGVYILYGLPGQKFEEVEKMIASLRAMGCRPFMAEYSPLPGTPLMEEAQKHSPFDLASEPLYHNNSFFPCRNDDFSWDRIWAIKRAAKD